jgi:hypothetical protein
LDAGNSKSYPASGTVWSDLSGNGNTATLVNGVGYSTTNLGSLSFDGTNDYVQTTRNDISNNSSFSLSCWFRITTLNSTYRPLIDCGNLGVGTLGYTLSITNSNKLFIASNGGFITISNTISTNVWYHIVGTANSGTPYSFNIYLNGVLGTVESSASTNLLTNNATYISMGRNINGSQLLFPGNIAQAHVHNRALSATEVLQNYNATKGRFNL